MGWSSDETRLFIKLYLSNSCLWNPEDGGYRNRLIRREAYQDMSKRFQALTNKIMTEVEVKMKIKTLRSTYCQEIRKMHLRGCDPDSDSPFKTTLKWFDDIYQCFKAHNIPTKMYDKTSSTDEPQELETEADDCSQKVWMPTAPIDDSLTEIDAEENPFPSDPDGEYLLLLKQEPYQDPIEMEHKPFKTRKRKFKMETSKSDQGSDVKPSKSTVDDEYDIYGKYIASQLRCMGVERAMRVQLQIQTLVSEARIDSLTGQKDSQSN